MKFGTHGLVPTAKRLQEYTSLTLGHTARSHSSVYAADCRETVHDVRAAVVCSSALIVQKRTGSYRQRAHGEAIMVDEGQRVHTRKGRGRSIRTMSLQQTNSSPGTEHAMGSAGYYVLTSGRSAFRHTLLQRQRGDQRALRHDPRHGDCAARFAAASTAALRTAQDSVGVENALSELAARCARGLCIGLKIQRGSWWLELLHTCIALCFLLQ